ncbi:tRNA nucleotidyltransferase (CCA-adding enzyme) [Desulfobacula phenolica]|uniref:tRNA nucleotidyltransferase (CCA-adding enzyme) n=1 Tax=Desulfobacula phenolica TaxID=90732 RepID=A0A1H2IDU5_9BACT|nr:tRNA nucleotidyltransferase (CCA-adding enzyme) [Desulfobacula phenolica]
MCDLQFIRVGSLILHKTDKTVRFILNTLREKGFSAYIVGGAVRDILLQRVPDDVDVLTCASIQEIESVFLGQNIKRVGKTFPICLVNGVEISSGRALFDVSTFPESDLAKRDFTINAMAYDPMAKKVIDPFNGRKDLEDGVIRFTQDPEKRIGEDPVRMVRACRFMAMIQGSFDASSLKGIIACKDLLDSAAAKERISHEIMKAMDLEKPSLFFRALKTTGLLSKIFPSLDQCHDLDGGPHHGETVFEHCMLVGDALPKGFPILRLAGFLHDAGKFDAAKIEAGKLTFIGHEMQTQGVIRDLTTLRFALKDISYITSLIQVHMRPLTDESTPRAVRRLLCTLEQYNLDYRDFMRMRIADKKGNLLKRPYTLSEIRVRLKKIFDELAEQSGFRMSHLEITGDDIMRILGIASGPQVGRIKQLLFEKVLDDPGLNNYKELKKICRCLKIKK